MSPAIAVLAAVLAVDGGVDERCPPAAMLVFQARNGVAGAREAIRIALTSRASSCGPYAELPGALNQPADLWALDLLRDVALDQGNGFSPLALVAWWGLRPAADRSLPRRVIENRALAEEDPTRLVALELLARDNEPAAAAERLRLRSRTCARARESRQLGLGWEQGLSSSPEQEATLRAVVGFVCAETPAAAAGFQVGDEVLAVDGRLCSGWASCVKALLTARSAGKPFDVAVATTDQHLVIRRTTPDLVERPRRK